MAILFAGDTSRYPTDLGLAAVATRYNNNAQPTTIVGSDASLSPPKSRGYNNQDSHHHNQENHQPFGPVQHATSLLSEILPDTRRQSAVSTRYNNNAQPSIIGSDASLSTPKLRDNHGRDSYCNQDHQPFGVAQQTSMLSGILPDTHRSSAAAVRYNE